MVHQVIFINLFFVPVLPLYEICRKSGNFKVSTHLISRYCILAACNVPLTKVFIFLAKKVNGTYISIDSGYYTLAALISAYLISKLWAFFQMVHIEFEITKSDNDANEK